MRRRRPRSGHAAWFGASGFQRCGRNRGAGVGGAPLSQVPAAESRGPSEPRDGMLWSMAGPSLCVSFWVRYAFRFALPVFLRTPAKTKETKRSRTPARRRSGPALLWRARCPPQNSRGAPLPGDSAPGDAR
eukprot:4899669-Pyramimonas_sp.AAC.1